MADIQSLKCPSCGSAIPKNSTACQYCGTRVVLSNDGTRFVLVGAICPACGENNKEDNNFCSKCGYELIRFCSLCHSRMPRDAEHCPKCGKTETQIQSSRDIDKEIESLQGTVKKAVGELSNFDNNFACGLIMAVVGGVFAYFSADLGGGWMFILLVVVACAGIFMVRAHLKNPEKGNELRSVIIECQNKIAALEKRKEGL